MLLAVFMAVFSLSLSACGSGKKKAEVPDESANTEQQEQDNMSVSQDLESQSSEETSSTVQEK
ncbi:MAG: hypothetical protein LBQ99_03030 [Endomicrobium sp.]|nr:hypothetical protein [Endomicrobium sp.]